MADVKKINGYNIKDEIARNGLEEKQDIIQVDELPTASAENEGAIYEYTGLTTADYTNGQFYKNTHVVEEEAIQIFLSGGRATLTPSINLTTFKNYVNPTEDMVLVFSYLGVNWYLNDSTEGGAITLSNYGITYTGGNPTGSPNYTRFTVVYTKAKDVYEWKQEDLTDDKSGKYLVNITDEATESFIDSRVKTSSANSVPANSVVIGKNSTSLGAMCVTIGNKSKQQNPFGKCVTVGYEAEGGTVDSVTIGTSTHGQQKSVTIGNYSYSFGQNNVVIGDFSTTPDSEIRKANSQCVVIGSASRPNGMSYSVCIGYYAYLYGSNATAVGFYSVAGSSSVAIGNGAEASNVYGGSNSVAVGVSAKANAMNSIAIGSGAVCSVAQSTQIGKGTANANNAVFFGNNTFGNFKVFDFSKGTVPYAVISTDTPIGGQFLCYDGSTNSLVFEDVVTEVNWGDIGGSLENQTDLKAVLDSKVQQYETMPTASEDYEGKLIQYIGNTSPFIYGYFYECVEESIPTTTYTTTNWTPVVTIDAQMFTQVMSALFFDYQPLPDDTYTFTYDNRIGLDKWTIEANGKSITLGYGEDLTRFGISYNSSPVRNAIIDVTTEEEGDFGYIWIRRNVQPETSIVNNLSSTSVSSALSANQGRVLKDLIDNISTVGRFLAMWDASDGTARYLPTVPFTYEQGDYYIVSAVAEPKQDTLTPVYSPDGGGNVHNISITDIQDWINTFGYTDQTKVFTFVSGVLWSDGTNSYDMQEIGLTYYGAALPGDHMTITFTTAKTNYMPEGSSYTTASTTVATDDVQVSDMYFYNGSVWIYLPNHEKKIAVDDELDPDSTNPVENRVVTEALTNKQDKLIAGRNITIEGNVISAEGGGGGSGGDSVGVPQITSAFPTSQTNLHNTEWKGRYSPIYFTTNLNITQLIENMNKQYVSVAKYSKQNRKTSSNARGKMTVINDRRVRLDRRFYCFRFDDDSSLDYDNPYRWQYFYCEIEDAQQAYNESASLYTSLGQVSCSNLATNINILRDSGNLFDDWSFGDLKRYEKGDINTFINVKTNLSESYLDGVYNCYEYTYNDKTYFVWKKAGQQQNTVYLYKVDGEIVPNYVVKFFDELTEVSNSTISEFTLVRYRADLDFTKFNYDAYNLSELSDALYTYTLDDSYLGDGHCMWNSYWFDFPIIPVLLGDCYIYYPTRYYAPGDVSTHIPYTGVRIKLKDFVRYVEEDERKTMDDFFKSTDTIKLELPYDTYYIYMRICGWQKKCFSEDMWDIKCDMIEAISNGAFAARGFGSMRGHQWRYNGHSTALNTYLEFNLMEPYCVISGMPSKSTPVQKRLTMTTQQGKQTIRD